MEWCSSGSSGGGGGSFGLVFPTEVGVLQCF